MEKKYEFTGETIEFDGHILHQIRAVSEIKLRMRYYFDGKIRSGNLFGEGEFTVVEIGDLGGWIESEDNLSQSGSCWIFSGSYVYRNSRISGDAIINDFCDIKNTIVTDSNVISGCLDENLVIENSILLGDSILSCRRIRNSIIKDFNENNTTKTGYHISENINDTSLTLSDIERIILWKNGLWKRNTSLQITL